MTIFSRRVEEALLLRKSFLEGGILDTQLLRELIHRHTLSIFSPSFLFLFLFFFFFFFLSVPILLLIFPRVSYKCVTTRVFEKGLLYVLYYSPRPPLISFGRTFFLLLFSYSKGVVGNSILNGRGEGSHFWKDDGDSGGSKIFQSW
ncbi:hypothetical protein K445DRAFT_117314 [Daldinia sp. EC12]|nr:hypothetical protein K445DRAFT_117314 [Daldinia sp. EC12]